MRFLRYHIWLGYALALIALGYIAGWLAVLPRGVAMAFVGAALIYWLLFSFVWGFRANVWRNLKRLDRRLSGKDVTSRFDDL